MPLGRPSARSLALVVVTSVAASLAACGEIGEQSDEGPAPVPCSAASATATTSILLSGMQFLPFCAAVPVGTEVTFTNADSVNHTVTADQGQPEPFESGLLYPGGHFSHTFSRAETVRVHCRLNPQMSGVVIVQ